MAEIAGDLWESSHPGDTWEFSHPNEISSPQNPVDQHTGGTDQENAELKALEIELSQDPDNFEIWERLLNTTEAVDGGVTRNSHPQAIQMVRNVYDRLLTKFPLMFVYWKKYADREFGFAGTESADMIYERGVASIPTSVDLWASYCDFKVQTCHVVDEVREIFSRGADSCGSDFLSHPFWDKYIEYEDRNECPDKVFEILARLIRIPCHQYTRYFQRYRSMSPNRPLVELVAAEKLDEFRSEVTVKLGESAMESQIEHELRLRIDNYYLETFQTTQNETNIRWAFESEIKRPYFHVTELDESELTNWWNYLDFEESQNVFERTTFLYERCLVTCARYEKFWFRYARWMLAQEDKESHFDKQSNTRFIYQRACAVFLPISEPKIRLQYSYTEEMADRTDLAIELHNSMLDNLPDHVDTINSLANMSRRDAGLDAAVQVYKKQIDSDKSAMTTKGILVAEWARLLWKVQGTPDEARGVFQTYQQYYLDNRSFWSSYLLFEIEQPTSAATEHDHYKRIKEVMSEFESKSTVHPDVHVELVQIYMKYLLERGDKGATKEYMALDQKLYGPSHAKQIEGVSLSSANLQY
ncbi:hypothetical protein N7495_006792 [Penicillium taxi]|uniref:uncharacterized protein n=1 Tax=Penicillium taxi TaxID=168475 RepID=UPI0025458722|nr:uncharacterized protein N7495_006792 [Penicillium taxi]KAJ5895101.1 hypothetical protein N7495_006792 [Penicillium taxi]